MLIQCDYQTGDYLIKNSTVYYLGLKVSLPNPTPIWAVGTDELYIMQAKFPLKCAWLAIFQSRYPVFYECSEVEMSAERVILHLMNGEHKIVKPLKDGANDRLLLDPLNFK